MLCLTKCKECGVDETGRNTHHSRGAFDDLPGLALLVNLAEAGPLPKLHVGVNLDQWDAVLLAESSDQLLVHRLVTVISQDAEQGLSAE